MLKLLLGFLEIWLNIFKKIFFYAQQLFKLNVRITWKWPQAEEDGVEEGEEGGGEKADEEEEEVEEEEEEGEKEE